LILLYSDIANNPGQHTSWLELYNIQDIKKDLLNDGYSEELTIDFLKTNQYLMIDTCYYDETFKSKLLSHLDNIDKKCNGLLILSENFQGLNILTNKYNKNINTIYIDPPYNAKSSEILYKNTFRDSSWLSLIEGRLIVAKQLQKDEGVLTIAIDEIEQEVLGQLLSQHYPQHEKSCIAVNHNPSGQQGDNFSFTHEYAYFIYPKPGRYIGKQTRDNKEDWDERNFRDVTGDDSLRNAGANCFYPIYIKDQEVVGFGDVCPTDYHPEINEKKEDGVIAVFPIDPEGIERKWRYARNTVESIKSELKVHYLKKREVFDIKRLKKTFNFKSNWTDSRYSANNHGTQLLNNIIPNASASYPKSLFTVKDALIAGTNKDQNAIILDYFAGSGTTGHAVLYLNRKDEGKRKYILIEMDKDLFFNVIKPRIMKICYSKTWKKGAPQERNSGFSNWFKYIRLEQYEDTLSNIVFKKKGEAVQETLQTFDDYFVRYMLDYETQGSPTRLNTDDFEDPFAYKIKTISGDEEKIEPVDLVETFNLLIGLWVDTIRTEKDEDRYYKAVRGKTLDEKSVVVVWRSTKDIDLIKDKKFIKDKFLEDEKPDTLYVNGMCHVEGSQSIEPVFKKLMGA